MAFPMGTRYDFTDGPSKHDLMLGLFDRHPRGFNGLRTLIFYYGKHGSTELPVSINGVQSGGDDGLETWIIDCAIHSPLENGRSQEVVWVKIKYSSRSRKGVLLEGGVRFYALLQKYYPKAEHS